MHPLLEASPRVEAYRARPLTISEIDGHLDSARIWATLMEIAEFVERGVSIEKEESAQRAIEASEDAGEQAADDEREECILLVDDAVGRCLKFVDRHVSCENREALLDQIRAIGEALI